MNLPREVNARRAVAEKIWERLRQVPSSAPSASTPHITNAAYSQVFRDQRKKPRTEGVAASSIASSP